jgi:hypothetical protein
MRNDLVDEQLKHQRRGEGDDAGHCRRDRNIAKQFAMPENLGHEPAKAEGLCFVAPLMRALAQDQGAGPRPDELVKRDERRSVPLRLRIEDGSGRPFGPVDRIDDDHPIAALQQGHDRIGIIEGGQFIPFAAAQDLAAQTDIAHDPQDGTQCVRFAEGGEIFRFQKHATV